MRIAVVCPSAKETEEPAPRLGSTLPKREGDAIASCSYRQLQDRTTSEGSSTSLRIFPTAFLLARLSNPRFPAPVCPQNVSLPKSRHGVTIAGELSEGAARIEAVSPSCSDKHDSRMEPWA